MFCPCIHVVIVLFTSGSFYSCVIQKCVISSGVVIENNCNLNDCQVGQDTRVASGTKLESESITAADN